MDSTPAMKFERNAEIINETEGEEVEINFIEHPVGSSDGKFTHSLLDVLFDEDRKSDEDERKTDDENDSKDEGEHRQDDLFITTGTDVTPDAILQQARSATPSRRRTRNGKDQRAQQIINNARKASTKRDTSTRIRSTKEVLKLVGKVLPTASTHAGSIPASSYAEEVSPPVRDNRSLASVSFGGGPNPRNLDLAKLAMNPKLGMAASVDDYERAVKDLSSKLSDTQIGREDMLNKLDGIEPGPKPSSHSAEEEETDDIVEKQGKGLVVSPNSPSSFSIFNFLMGNGENGDFRQSRAFSPITCGNMNAASDIMTENILSNPSLLSHSSIGDALSTPRNPPSLAESIHELDVDPRMPAWVSAQNSIEEDADTPRESFYSLATSRTVVVHEIARGNWTWCTAWSHDGTKLAIGTENHHLAVVDASASTVWRVRHDKRITGPVRNDTTHTIRSIAWGDQFIAIGGTGNAVSILAPIEPYPILHTVTSTGFVGSLDWKPNSAILAIGSRDDKCIIVSIAADDDNERTGPPGSARRIVSKHLHEIKRKDWVNSVAFSPGGSVLAIGDRSGLLSVQSVESGLRLESKITPVTHFKIEDAILDVEWSPDGKWLYCGGEDFAVTIIETSSWTVKQKVSRERWVQFISSSNRGSHIAIGGITSEVSILSVEDDWKEVMNIELKGLVPLSANWHPKDQYLAVTGQDNSVVVIETTNARHVKGHCLKSFASIYAVEFSPNGQFIVVGNTSGIVTFYRSSGISFVTAYEMVLSDTASQSIAWSPNDEYIVIGSGETLVVVEKKNPDQMSSKIPPRSSGLGIKKTIRDVIINSIAIQNSSKHIAVAGVKTWILDSEDNFKCVQQWDHGMVHSIAWSADGVWLATVGPSHKLSIFNTSAAKAKDWRVIFSLDCEAAGHALAWGPSVVEGLQYLAFGGQDSSVSVIEIRTYEGAWETVLRVKRNGVINDLDWNSSGMLAVGVGDGTVTIIDLAYLLSGVAVNEMDYNWQRQGVTCFTEIRRNKGKNSMRTVKWIPSGSGMDSLLAIGGSDGAVEVIDLTERAKCKGFGN